MFDNKTDLQELADELNLDPNAYGYSGMRDFEASETINLLRAGTKIDRDRVLTEEVVAVIDDRDLPTANYQGAGHLHAYLQAILSGEFMLIGPETRNGIGRILSGAFGTVTRINALIDKDPACRAEELWGEDSQTTATDCANARKLIVTTRGGP